MQKWKTARADLAEEEALDADEEEALPPAELLEERKRKRVAEWRAGVAPADAKGNANFVPVDDWHERIARAAKRPK